jgi:hypothetical protein
MNDCYSTASYGTSAGLRIETTASSFFALPYHQLEKVEFESSDEKDTVIVSFVTCTVRITGKKLRRMAAQIATQEVQSMNATPKNSPPPEKNLARIDKIEVVEKENAA